MNITGKGERNVGGNSSFLSGWEKESGSGLYSGTQEIRKKGYVLCAEGRPGERKRNTKEKPKKYELTLSHCTEECAGEGYTGISDNTSGLRPGMKKRGDGGWQTNLKRTMCNE